VSRAQVPCYALTGLLTPEQLEIVRPFLRATFTEMWAELGDMPSRRVGPACDELLALATNGDTPGFWARLESISIDDWWMAAGREIEKLLYAKAQLAGLPVVDGPARARKS
jgi:hypothetical protein